MTLSRSRPKERECKVCRGLYTPAKPRQKVCSPLCAAALVKGAQAKKERTQAIRQARETRAKLKRRSDWMREAQAEFNKFIRARDADLPCICCGEYAPEESWKPGGAYDAGHFLSRGAYPELRFEEDNCHKQKKSCNGGSGKFAHKARTVSQSYRIRLIEKIGLERVEWLEGPHEPKNYTIDDLREIKVKYRAKRKALEASR